MSYTSRNPQHASVVLDDISSATPSNPPASKHKLIDRDGGLYLRNSAGIERRLAYGEAEINYIKNPNTVTSWGLVGDLNLSTTTTAAELPRENTTPSGIKITATSGAQTTADYVYFDINLDDSDLNRILKISWDQKKLGTYADGQLAVVITTQADRTTVVSTPSVSAIPAQDGTFAATFLSGSTATLSLVIRATGEMTTDDGIVISNVIVGPGQLVQGAPVGDWIDLTASISQPSGLGAGSGTYGLYRYRRVGSDIEIDGYWSKDGTPGSGASSVLFPLPAGITATTQYPLPGVIATFGVTHAVAAPASSFVTCGAELGSTTSFGAERQGSNTLVQGQHVPASSSFRFSIKANVVGWSSNIYLSGSTINSPAKAGFIQPYAGATAPSGWAICDGSELAISSYTALYAAIGTTWNTTTNPLTGSAQSSPSAGNFRIPNLKGVFLRGLADYSGADAYNTANDVTLGAYRVDQLQGHYHSTSIPNALSDVADNNYDLIASTTQGTTSISSGSPITDGTNGTPRVGYETAPKQIGVNYLIKLYDDLAAPAVGFYTAQVGTTGLVNNDAANTAGTPIKGRTDGVAPSAGYVGEEKKDETSGAVTTSGISSVGVVTLTTGLWLVTLNGVLAAAASLTGATCKLMIKGVDGTVRGKDTQDIIANSAVGGIFSFPAVVVNVASGDADKTVRGRVQTVGANTTAYTYISAVRIA